MNGISNEGNPQPQWGLGGKLIIKAQLKDDIRRIPIHNEDITYDELVLMMQRVFRGKLEATDDVLIKYKDEDGDLVTIFDSSDLAFAIQCSRTLKLTLLVNTTSEDPAGPQPSKQNIDYLSVHKELAAIRDRVNLLLDKLGSVPQPAPKTEASIPPVAEVKTAPPTIHPKEFDPFQQHSDSKEEEKRVSAAFGLPEHGSSSDVPAAAPRLTNPIIQPAVPTPAHSVPPQQPLIQPSSVQQMMGSQLAGQQPLGPQYSMYPQQQQQQQPTQQPTPQPQPTLQQQPTPQQQPTSQQQPGQQQQPIHSAFQPSTSSSFNLTSQPSSYPQAGYNPQPQQPYGASMNYNAPQTGPTPTPSTPFSAANPSQAYNPSGQALNQPPGPPGQPGQPGQIFSYPAYPPTATTPTNPYSRGGQPGYASRPQPPNYR